MLKLPNMHINAPSLLLLLLFSISNPKEQPFHFLLCKQALEGGCQVNISKNGRVVPPE